MRDYNNYDYLSVSVKSDQLGRILQGYRALGWTEEKTEDDRQYYDMKYVRLRRPHKIANKDRLQYLQVRMERSINSLVEITKRAHLRSTSLGALLFLAAAASLACGLWLAIAYAGGNAACGGYFLCGLAGVFAVLCAVICPVLRRREKKQATEKIVEKLRLIQNLMQEAVSLCPAEPAPSDGFEEEASNG